MRAHFVLRVRVKRFQISGSRVRVEPHRLCPREITRAAIPSLCGASTFSCQDCLCPVCLSKSFKDFDSRQEDEDGRRSVSLSPTLPLRSGTACASTTTEDPFVCGSMPEPCIDVDVEVMDKEGQKEKDRLYPAPKTPKRMPDIDSKDMSPAKTAKQGDPPQPEPTNSDLLQFMRHMQASQEQSMKLVTIRLDIAEGRLSRMEEQTTTRLDVLEAKLEMIEIADDHDKTARSRVAALEKSVKENADKLEKQLREARTSSTSGAASSSGSRGAQAQDLEPMVKIGSFEQETPRGALEEAWTNHIRPIVEKHMDVARAGVRAPYMLSSQLEARFSDLSQARAFLAALRKQDIIFKLNNHDIKIWGTSQKPKEVRERNRRLLRVAEVLLQHVGPNTFIHKETFKNSCWRSGAIVIGNRRIARNNREADDSFNIIWNEKWYDTQIFRGSAAQIESAAQMVMDDLLL